METGVSWPAGDGGNRARNTTFIAIEIIMDGNTNPEDIQAEDNGARLAACILKRHGLDISKLTTHKRWNGKNCPEVILPHWDKFVAKVTGYMKELENQPPIDYMAKYISLKSDLEQLLSKNQ